MPDPIPELRPPAALVRSTDSFAWANALLKVARANSVVMNDPFVLEMWFRHAIAAGCVSGVNSR